MHRYRFTVYFDFNYWTRADYFDGHNGLRKGRGRCTATKRHRGDKRANGQKSRVHFNAYSPYLMTGWIGFISRHSSPICGNGSFGAVSGYSTGGKLAILKGK